MTNFKVKIYLEDEEVKNVSDDIFEFQLNLTRQTTIYNMGHAYPRTNK